MIAVLKPGVSRQQVENLITWFKSRGLDVHISEGKFQTILGLIGAAIPLGVMLFVYHQTVEYVMNRFELLSGIIQFLPIGTFYPTMAAIALALGGGLGFFVSFFTIRRELRV